MIVVAFEEIIIMPAKKSRQAMPHSCFQPKGNHSKKRAKIETESGIECGELHWSILIKIVNDYPSRKMLKRFCKKHNVKYFPAGVKPDEDWKMIVIDEDGVEKKIPLPVENIGKFTDDYFCWYEVCGGKPIERLTDDQDDGSGCPEWVKEWSYVVGSVGVPRNSTPQVGSKGFTGEMNGVLGKASAVPGLIKRPKSKIKLFKYDEVNRYDYDIVIDKNENPVEVKSPVRRLVFPCKWEQLSNAQKAGLDEKMVVKLEWVEKRIFQKDHLILHMWTLGCVRPRRWTKDGWKDCN